MSLKLPGNHVVQLIHKSETDPNGHATAKLQVGKVFCFKRSGDAYQVRKSGALRRVNQPSRSKRERRAERRASGFVKLSRRQRHEIYLSLANETPPPAGLDGRIPEEQLKAIWKEFHVERTGI